MRFEDKLLYFILIKLTLFLIFDSFIYPQMHNLGY